MGTPGITLVDARRVLDAALDKAVQIGQPMNVAVVDAGGHLITFARQDDAILAGIDIAARKARTSVLFKLSTADVGELAKPGGALYGIEVTNDGLVIFGGGIPLFTEGTLAGAIGVSAGSVEQDVSVADAGVAAFGQ